MNHSLAGASPNVTHKEGKAIIQVASLFNQLLQHFPRTEFGSLVKKNDAERGAKGFGCWTQLVSMLFCQLAHADSLREICNGLGCCLGKLVHLGIAKAPNKSTLSYANEHRPAKLCEDLFYTALQRFREEEGMGPRKKKFRFKNKLLSLDSTTISLCLELFPWAKFRRAKGGVKASRPAGSRRLPAALRIDHRSQPQRCQDGRRLPAQPRLDCGNGSRVQRLRVVLPVDHRGNLFRHTPEGECGVRSGGGVCGSQGPQHPLRPTDPVYGRPGSKGLPCLLRRVVVWDAVNQREIVLLTNLLAFGATTIAAIYKDRWEIELFFKALKQNLKVKSFVGTSENALRIQIWTALIAILLLKWLHHLSKAKWSLSNLASMLRLNLFTYRDLRKWLDDPFETPPLLPESQQLTLGLA